MIDYISNGYWQSSKNNKNNLFSLSPIHCSYIRVCITDGTARILPWFLSLYLFRNKSPVSRILQRERVRMAGQDEDRKIRRSEKAQKPLCCCQESNQWPLSPEFVDSIHWTMALCLQQQKTYSLNPIDWNKIQNKKQNNEKPEVAQDLLQDNWTSSSQSGAD